MRRALNLLLLLTFLVGYLEWGKGQYSFLCQVEYDLLLKATTNPENFLHPLILLPFLGQVLIIYASLSTKPRRLLTLAGLACLSTIMLFLVLIGILGANLRILGSTLPFLISAGLVLRSNWKRESHPS